MENNEFGLESLKAEGLGLTDPSFHTIKSNFDGDFDSLALGIGSTENLIDFAETYNSLEAYNADQKIKMLKKLHVHTRNVPGKYGESVENYIIEQSLEEAATKESTGTSSSASFSKLPNKEAIGAQKKNFLASIWEKLKAFFMKIVNWIKEKISRIVAYFKNSKQSTQESVQTLTTCTKEESKDVWESLLSTTIDASSKSSAEGKEICITTDSINKFANTVEKFNEVGSLLIKCSTQVSKQGDYLKSGSSPTNFNDVIGVINNIHSVIVSKVPGAKQVPATIKDASKESIEKFNREFKECVSYLKWEHDPEGYTEMFTGRKLVAKKAGMDPSQYATMKYGTSNPAELRKNIASMNESLTTITATLNKLSHDVEEANTKFKKYLSEDGRNITESKHSEVVREYTGDKSSSADVTIVYQFATTTMVCFKLLNALISIASHICSTMTNELKELKDVLDNAAAAKKSGKWYQFIKKIRGGKASNDELKKLGLDTDNEKNIDNVNKFLDKTDDIAGKAGDFIDNVHGNIDEKRVQKKLGKQAKKEEKEQQKEYKKREREGMKKYKEEQKNAAANEIIKNADENNAAEERSRQRYQKAADMKKQREQQEADEKALQKHLAEMNADEYTTTGIKNNGYSGPIIDGAKPGEYTGWEEENVPRTKNGNVKRQKTIGSNESWLDIINTIV